MIKLLYVIIILCNINCEEVLYVNRVDVFDIK